MNKRQRGRGRKNSNNNNPNRSLDSNGPDVKIRGSANTIYDKYTTLARDAASSGHRVKAENYLQHAEHYLRLLMAQQAKAAEQKAAQEQARQQQNEGADGEQQDGDTQNRNNGKSRRYPPRRRQQGKDDSQAHAENTPDNVDANEAPKQNGKAESTVSAEATEKPKKTRSKKPVEAPEPENVSSAAE
ncbi:MAG: DUF4167 domain-containing protein [Acidimicrobiales bacterium]|nr:DUF4167 domain-containing protein [Hyphomonadaceae bacterium]RZV43640.1 MAG: DUF4167 domain-containing protein [Acidimicrobiales bacterium]